MFANEVTMEVRLLMVLRNPFVMLPVVLNDVMNVTNIWAFIHGVESKIKFIIEIPMLIEVYVVQFVSVVE